MVRQSPTLHARIVHFELVVGLVFQVIKQIHVIGIIKLEPVGYGAAALFGEKGADSLAKGRIEDFAETDHLMLSGCLI